ncbi:type III secretion inner membrane ring lipoprotein SctJ [Bradyrhizobium sp. 160]|uniref:type III secretion system inner membrane ring lipoprotein SctJ n=1 Tax=Bradyrhizobium sp. 160 TaxID=2782634 RepID=UPI001FFAFCBC|nr:type III secretion inner membrane ring lipoprotein SctJ [Bradyrhizobium sp. 160]MCK1627317.1 type III secretion inner membrane ring lipoprotein SctJ [Bradyrhizobium sp. 160]
MARVLKRAVALLVLFTLLGCGSKIELYRNLSAREANEMLALLMRQGIRAERTTDTGGTSSLVVPTEDVPRAMNVLDSAGWPRDHFADMGTLFKKDRMISSDIEERVRYIYGVTQELSQTLSIIDGVLNARVHTVLPETASDDRNPPASSTAAVLVRYKPGAPIDQIVPKIKELVANSLRGLSYDRVSVALVEANQDNTTLGRTDFTAGASERPFPLFLLICLVGAIAASLIGNAVLVVLIWRLRSGRSDGTAA